MGTTSITIDDSYYALLSAGVKFIPAKDAGLFVKLIFNKFLYSHDIIFPDTRYGISIGWIF
jgi:uncharacterized membrane-anchored protein